MHNAAVASDYWVTVFEVKWRILFGVQQPKEYDLTKKLNAVFFFWIIHMRKVKGFLKPNDKC